MSISFSSRARTGEKRIRLSANSSTAESSMQILAGHLAAKYLMAANQLGVFEALAAAPLTIESLAQKTGLPVRTLQILVRPLAEHAASRMRGRFVPEWTMPRTPASSGASWP